MFHSLIWNFRAILMLYGLTLPNSMKKMTIWKMLVLFLNVLFQSIYARYFKELCHANPSRSLPTCATNNYLRIIFTWNKFYHIYLCFTTRKLRWCIFLILHETNLMLVWFQVQQLCTVWCEWSEMELRHQNFEAALLVMQRATSMCYCIPSILILFKSTWFYKCLC